MELDFQKKKSVMSDFFIEPHLLAYHYIILDFSPTRVQVF